MILRYFLREVLRGKNFLDDLLPSLAIVSLFTPQISTYLPRGLTALRGRGFGSLRLQVLPGACFCLCH